MFDNGFNLELYLALYLIVFSIVHCGHTIVRDCNTNNCNRASEGILLNILTLFARVGLNALALYYGIYFWSNLNV